MLAILVITAFASASEPMAAVVESGKIRGQTSLDVPPAAFLAKLADPIWVTQVDARGTEVVIRERDGDCMIADFKAPSMLGPVEYTVRRCAVPDGMVATLVSSDTFTRYGVRWRALPQGQGTLLTYDIELVTNLMVPQMFVNSSTRKAVEHLMEAMQEEFAEGATDAEQ